MRGVGGRFNGYARDRVACGAISGLWRIHDPACQTGTILVSAKANNGHTTFDLYLLCQHQWV